MSPLVKYYGSAIPAIGIGVASAAWVLSIAGNVTDFTSIDFLTAPDA
jgi:hypothetical protein